jgi:hypothetical protein
MLFELYACVSERLDARIALRSQRAGASPAFTRLCEPFLLAGHKASGDTRRGAARAVASTILTGGVVAVCALQAAYRAPRSQNLMNLTDGTIKRTWSSNAATASSASSTTPCFRVICGAFKQERLLECLEEHAR